MGLMRDELLFNPLDKRNLGISVTDALLGRPRSPLPPDKKFDGAGVYAIYYRGSFELYKPVAASTKGDEDDDKPIYVGKAVPAGARKGGQGLDSEPGPVLFKRLSEHAESISQAENLRLNDFFCRYLTVDDIWIPLGENLLIEMFMPLWNLVIEGFGNHDPGKGRHQGKRSPWDVLHPGRTWADRLQPGNDLNSLTEAVRNFHAKARA